MLFMVLPIIRLVVHVFKWLLHSDESTRDSIPVFVHKNLKLQNRKTKSKVENCK